MAYERAPAVVVIGAGFGGLAATQALGRAGVDVTLIDQHNHHLFQPLLYQVATAALSPAEIAWPIRRLVRDFPSVNVVMAQVMGIDFDGREITTDRGDVRYDHLVIATGAAASFFGHPEWQETASPLKTLEDALLMRDRILRAFERAETAATPDETRRHLTFVVVGGGPTGLEIAGAVAELARDGLRGEFRRVRTERARIVLLDSGTRLLASFPERLSSYARSALEALGVEIQLKTRVSKCDERGVDTSNGRIDATTVLWGAGVRPAPLAEKLGLAKDAAGRIKVDCELRVPGRPEVFVVGDAAGAIGSNGAPLPGLAATAKQMGRYVGNRLAAELYGMRPIQPFRYKHAGDLATIGRARAAVHLTHIGELTGFAGWALWSAAHIFFLIGTRNRVAVAADWAWSFATRQREARLIVAPPDPEWRTDARH